MRSSAVIAALFLLLATSAMAQNVVAPSGSIGGVGSLKLGSVSINQPVNPVTVGAAAPGVCPANQYETQDTTTGPVCAQPSFSQLTGTATDSQLASAYSGVGVCGAHSWASTLTRNAGPTCTQPSFSDLLGTLGTGQFTATTCTNQFVSALSNSGAATCTTDTLASAQHANQGTTTTVLHGNATGNPSWASVADADLANAYSGTGACAANKFETADNRNAVPTCTQPATTNLSDVSSGTWTPAIVGDTIAGTFTYRFQLGRYVVIGPLVYATFFVSWSAMSVTPTGSVGITGLPFTSSNAGSAIVTENHLGDYAGVTEDAGFAVLDAEINPNSAKAYLQENGSGKTSVYITGTNLGATGFINGTLLYLRI